MTVHTVCSCKNLLEDNFIQLKPSDFLLNSALTEAKEVARNSVKITF